MKKALLIALLVTGCAAPASQEKLTSNYALALENTVTCAKSFVAEMDDRRFPTTEIALYLSYRCTRQYDALTDAAAAVMFSEPEKQTAFRALRAEKAERVATFLNVVEQYRAATR